MRTLSWDDYAAGDLAGLPLAATIGVFDGLHIGHRRLIASVLGREGLSSAVFTFRTNPKRRFSPESFGGELSTLEQRLGLIASLGADFAVLIDFSGDFSKLPGRRFLSMLESGSALRYLTVGSNFRCGHRLDTDAEGISLFCRERGIEMEALASVSWSGHPVSSSRIRKAVRDGRLEDVAAMLGRLYELDLRGCEPDKDGLWRAREDQVPPPPGLYEASLVYAGAAALPTVARHDGKGLWSLGDAVRAPVGLGLTRLVSRE